MSAPKQADILSYWTWFETCDQLNNPLDSGIQASQIDFTEGIWLDAPEKFCGTVWLAPFSFQHENKSVPLFWLPCEIKHSRLHPNRVSLPFIPPSVTEPWGPYRTALPKQEIIDTLIAEYFMNDDVPKVFDWNAYWRCAQDFARRLTNETQTFGETCFVFLPKVYDELKMSKVLERFLAVDPVRSERWSLSPNLREQAHTLAFSSHTVCDAGTLAFAGQLLKLPEDHMQAVYAPSASQVRNVIDVIIGSLLVEAVFDSKSVQIGLICHPEMKPFWEHIATVQAEQEGDSNRKWPLTLTESLKESQKTMRGLQLGTEGIETLEAQKNERKKLLAKDEKLEKKLANINKLQQLWIKKQKRSLYRKLKDLLLGYTDTLRQAEFLNLHVKNLTLPDAETLEESLVLVKAQIKVDRTKIHRTLTILSESIAELDSSYSALKRYQETHELSENVEVETLRLFNEFGPHHFAFAKQVYTSQKRKTWLTILSKDELSLCADNQVFDWLIVTDGHDVPPYALTAPLQNAKRLLVMGDKTLQAPKPVSSWIDGSVVKCLKVAESEEAVEDLGFSGHILSQSSSYLLSAAHSYWMIQQEDEHSLAQPPRLHQVSFERKLGIYYKQFIDAEALLHSEADFLQFVPVEAKAEEVNQWVNLAEAQAIIDYVQAHPNDSIAVVTLSHQQKHLIDLKLKEAKLNCSSFLLEQCPLRVYSQVLFSPVYTHLYPKPHRLDCGESLLNRLIAIPRTSLVLFADPLLGEPGRHTPTSHFYQLITKVISENSEVEAIQ